MKLLNAKISLIFLLFTVFVIGQETYRDNFSSKSYSNNNGSSNFSSNWNESNDNNNASSGNIRITGNRLRFEEISKNDERIQRSVDLNGASSATLSFNWETSELDGSGGNSEELSIQISSNGTSFTTIGTFRGDQSGTFNQNILAYASANTTVRFINVSNWQYGDWEEDEYVYIDNFLISATFPPPTPIMEINNVTVNEGAGNATFIITHTGAGTTLPFTVNYTTVNGSATSGNDYTATTGPLVFSGTTGETKNITVPILDDTIIESIETFVIQFTSTSNLSVDITDTGTGSITDNDSYIITDGVTDTTCSGAFFDSGGVSGNHSNNEDITYTLCPSTANTDVRIDFISFDVESGYDFLYIYDGTTTSATLIGQFHNGNVPPSTITATNASGCLTFRFVSDYSVNNSGWEASISCATRGPVLSIDDVTVDEDGVNAIFTVVHTDASALGSFTVNYQTVNGTAISGSDFTATTGTLNFNGLSGDTETITVPILDDAAIENPEIFTIQLTASSNNTVDISDTATGTIIDDDALIMTNGGIANTCNDTFFDPSGVNNYNNNENVVYTICPDTADTYINIDFTSFEVVTGDVLYIYDGDSTSDPLIGQYDSANIPTIINSSDISGCLTFRFISNGNGTGAGWEAAINCYPEGPVIIIDDITFDEDIGNAVFTVRSTRAAHGTDVFLFGFQNRPFTVDFQTVNGTALSGSDYTATSGVLTFSGALNNVQTISVPIANDGSPEFAEDFTIEFTGATAQFATVNYTDLGTGTINSQILANDPLTLFQEFDGYYDYSTTGGTLRTGANGASPCAITTSSSNSLISPIPNTATIERAYLYWAHSNTVRDDQVTFEGQAVSANFLYQTSLTNRNFYGYVSDVTAIVQGVSNPSTNVFDFSDLDIDNTGSYCNTSTVLGGWTLIVFYEDPSLPAVNINLYQGFDGLSNEGTSFTLDSFYAISGSGAKASFLSWEGDPDLNGSSSGSSNPEALSITNQSNTTFALSGDGGQTGNNAYNSTIYDNTVSPVYNTSNSYGVDLDTYDISSFISPTDSQVTANVDVGQDFVISAAVVLKVPSNLIAGNVFEDVNYPGGVGRDKVTSGGVGTSGSIVELFDSSGNFLQRKNTDINGNYSFGGMADGDYSIKVVNSTVRSSRVGGLNCSACYPIQTYRSYKGASSLIDVTNEVGGINPSATQDVALGVLTNAQSVSAVSVSGNGVVGINFGFNFNTIVNSNFYGQGSLEQFIINSNNLEETTLDIEANSIFNPALGEDVSIFMIPSASDPLGRTMDTNFSGGVITITNTAVLSEIISDNTHIDGRTQTANIGDTNSGSIGTGGTVGVDAEPLPSYLLPEIAINGDDKQGITLGGDPSNVVIRNLAIYNATRAIDGKGDGGLGSDRTISEMLLGVLPNGNDPGAALRNTSYGVRLESPAQVTVTSSYIGYNGNGGLLGVSSGSQLSATYNEVFLNGGDTDSHNGIDVDGVNGTIQYNLIYGQKTLSGTPTGEGGNGIELGSTSAIAGSNLIDNNTIYNNLSAGVSLRNGASGNTVSKNMIYNNEVGISVNNESSSTNSNRLTQNSIYANNGLGIDLYGGGTGDFDGVTLNDNGDVDSGGNDLLNFPIISGAYQSGSTFIIEGWSRPGAIIEVFITDISEGTATVGDNQFGMSTDYGEGQLYLGTFIEGSGSDTDNGSSSYLDEDGNTDTTNKYRFVTALAPGSGAALGKYITSTATISNSTSEFSPISVIKGYNVITNRSITFRVKNK